jgi:hypothetical protein
MKDPEMLKQKMLGEALEEEGFSPTGEHRLIVRRGPPRNPLHIAFHVHGHLRDQIAAAADQYEALAADLRRVLEEGYPKLSEDTPLLDNFVFAKRGATCLKGNAVYHPSLDATIVTTTSALALISLEAGVARTQSRWYRLGQRLEQDDLTEIALGDIIGT